MSFSSSAAQAAGGFSTEWIEFYLKDRESWSPRRLRVEYECTYLTRGTLGRVGRMLDAGCGGGFLVKYLEQSGYRGAYVGIDRAPVSIKAAKARFAGREFLLTDTQDLPFDPDAFDLAYSRDVVIHVPSPYDAIRELYRVSGSILLRVRTAEIPSLFTARYKDGGAVDLEAGRVKRFAHQGGVHHFFPLPELLAFLQGLSPVPQQIRYRVHLRHPRAFDAVLYENHGGFPSYWVTDLLITKSRPGRAGTPSAINDTDSTVLQGALRRIWGADQRAYLSAT